MGDIPLFVFCLCVPLCSTIHTRLNQKTYGKIVQSILGVIPMKISCEDFSSYSKCAMELGWEHSLCRDFRRTGRIDELHKIQHDVQLLNILLEIFLFNAPKYWETKHQKMYKEGITPNKKGWDHVSKVLKLIFRKPEQKSTLCEAPVVIKTQQPPHWTKRLINNGFLVTVVSYIQY